MLGSRIFDVIVIGGGPAGLSAALMLGRCRRLRHTAGHLTAIVFRNGEIIDRDALFFSGGQHEHCDLAVKLGCSFTPRGTVSTGTLSNTNVAGDASRDAQFVVVAAAEGVKVAMAINQALQREELAA